MCNFQKTEAVSLCRRSRLDAVIALIWQQTNDQCGREEKTEVKTAFAAKDDTLDDGHLKV